MDRFACDWHRLAVGSPCDAGAPSDATTDPDGLHDQTLAAHQLANRSGVPSVDMSSPSGGRDAGDRATARPLASRARWASRTVDPVVSTSSQTTTWARLDRRPGSRASAGGGSASTRPCWRARSAASRPAWSAAPARAEQRRDAVASFADAAAGAAARRERHIGSWPRGGRHPAGTAPGPAAAAPRGRGRAAAPDRLREQVAQRRARAHTGRGPCGPPPAPAAAPSYASAAQAAPARRARAPATPTRAGRGRPSRRPGTASGPGGRTPRTGCRGTGRGPRRAPGHASSRCRTTATAGAAPVDQPT